MIQLTVVQTIQAAHLSCHAQPTPAAIRPGKKGPLFLYRPGAIVLYSITHPRRSQAFLFRTLDEEGQGRETAHGSAQGRAPGPRGATLPGVFPAVRLLLYAQTKGQLLRLQQALRFLEQTVSVASLDHLSDVLFLRLQSLIERRALRYQDLELLLAQMRPRTFNI
jgi:hypothetical protein